MENWFSMMVPKAIAAYYEKVRTNDIPMLGPALFPSKSKQGLRLEYIKGYDSVPALLTPSAFDTKPPLRVGGQIETEGTKMPFFRESIHFTEEDRQLLLMFQDANRGSAYAAEIIRRFFDNAKDLIDGANFVPEVMRMGLLTAGKFSLATTDTNKSQTVNYDYNYDPKGTWASKNVTTLTTNSTWNNTTTADPIRDIIKVKEAAAARGITLTRMIVGPKTMSYLVANEKILKNMFYIKSNLIGALPTDVTSDAVRTYILSATGVSVTVYDKQYVDYEGSSKFFYPEEKFATLLPAGTLGNTWYGTTPEQADLMSGNVDCDVTILGSGLALCQKKESLPVNVITWVSEIVLPSFENMNRVFNIKWE